VTETTTLREFNADTARRRALAAAVGSSPDYLWQLGVGWDNKRPGIALAKAIERESEKIWRRIPKGSMRPDVWDEEGSSS
jgi:hypothetical protein